MTAGLDIPWVWLLVRSSGVSAFVLLTAVVCLGLALRTRVVAVPPARLLSVHRALAVSALAMLALHMGLLLVDPVVPFTLVEVLVPLASRFEPVAVALGVVAFWLLLAPLVATWCRPLLGSVAAQLFKRSHLAAYAAWPLAAGHFVLAGTDASRLWALGLLVGAAGVVAGLLLVRGVVGRRRAVRTSRAVR